MPGRPIGVIGFDFNHNAFKTDHCAGKDAGKQGYILHAL